MAEGSRQQCSPARCKAAADRMAEQQAVECEQGSEVAGADEVEVFAEAVAAAAAIRLL